MLWYFLGWLSYPWKSHTVATLAPSRAGNPAIWKGIYFCSSSCTTFQLFGAFWPNIFGLEQPDKLMSTWSITGLVWTEVGVSYSTGALFVVSVPSIDKASLIAMVLLKTLTRTNLVEEGYVSQDLTESRKWKQLWYQSMWRKPHHPCGFPRLTKFGTGPRW